MNWILWQFDGLWQKPRENLQKLDRDLRDYWADYLAAKSDSDSVLILPEMFASGFCMQPEQIAEPIDGMISRHLSGLAKQYRLQIIAGVAQKTEQGFENRALYFDRKGVFQAAYSKQKLFSYAQEQQSYIAGDKAVIVELLDGSATPIKAAIFICYDLRFPELFRQVAPEVEVMIIIANWPEQRQSHWRLLLQARAVENQLWVIGVNRLGKDANNLQYIGGSMVIDPYGKIVQDSLDFEANAKRGTELNSEVNAEITQISISTKVMLESVQQYRSRFPALADK